MYWCSKVRGRQASFLRKFLASLLMSNLLVASAYSEGNPADENIDLKLNNGTIATSCAFTDTPSSEWYTKYVMALCSAGIVIGYAEGNNRVFKPGQYATMAEFLKMLNYTNDYIGTTRACSSTKNATNWADCHMKLAGISSINVNSSVTRGAAFKHAVKAYFGVTNVGENDAAKYLASKGVINTASDYRLNDNVTRGEVAKITVNASGAARRAIAYWLIPVTIILGKDIPASLVTPPQSGNTLADKIVNRAKKEVGKKTAPWVDGTWTYCARFVRIMFDKPAKYPSAAKMCTALKGILKSGTPPKGSVICYQAYTSGGYGHVSIATGTGTEIGVTSLNAGVTELSATTVIKNGYWGYITADDFNRNY